MGSRRSTSSIARMPRRSSRRRTGHVLAAMLVAVGVFSSLGIAPAGAVNNLNPVTAAGFGATRPAAAIGVAGPDLLGSIDDSHSCAVTDESPVPAVKCWGEGTYGQMGNGTTTLNNTAQVDVALSTAAGANPVPRVSQSSAPPSHRPPVTPA